MAFPLTQMMIKGWAATAMIALSCMAGPSGAVAQGTNVNATSIPAAISITGERLSGLEQFDSAMVAFMRERKIPGASLAVVKHRRPFYARGFGLADVDRKEPVLPTSLFRIASSIVNVVMGLYDRHESLDARKAASI